MLVGKGHNGGDALIAAKRMLRTNFPPGPCLAPLFMGRVPSAYPTGPTELLELAAKRIEEMPPATEADGIDSPERVWSNNPANAGSMPPLMACSGCRQICLC